MSRPTPARGHDNVRPGALSTISALRAAEARMRWDPDRIRRHQLERLQEVITACQRSVPLYRRLYEGHDVTLHTLEHVAKVPMVDRRLLAAAPLDDRRSGPAATNTLVRHTSGSTGEYLVVETSARSSWGQGLLMLRRNRARGLQPWQRSASIRVAPDHRQSRGLLDVIARPQVVLDAGDAPEELARRLLARPPTGLNGFGHLLLDVAEHLDGRLAPRVLGTGGQVLSSADREALRAAYGSFPLDLYGAVEVGSIGWQCPAADLYHLDHDSVYVEVVDDQGQALAPEEIGEVLVTTLNNPHMPFVRYRLGDRGRLASRPCRCGWQGPTLQELEGRQMDRFVDHHGHAVATSRLFLSTQLSDVLPWVRRYRAIQDEERRVRVEILPEGTPPPWMTHRIVEEYQKVLGSSIPVTVVMLQEIPLEPSGKLRQFTSSSQVVPDND